VLFFCLDPPFQRVFRRHLHQFWSYLTNNFTFEFIEFFYVGYDEWNEFPEFYLFYYWIVQKVHTQKKKKKKQKKKRKLIYNKAIQHFFGFEVPLIEVVVSGGLRSPNGIPPEYTLSIGTIGLQEKRFSFLFHFVLAPPTL